MRIAILLCAVCGALTGIALWIGARRATPQPPTPQTILRRSRCPGGMAPEAWRAWVRSCYNAKISPNRITQTIGDSEHSVGYHHQDGWVRSGAIWLPYSAATDIHCAGLDNDAIARLLRAMGKQGFAAWYRHGPKWAGNEHIHAVYALLPMKPQLIMQVQHFFDQQRRLGNRVRWRHKCKRRYVNAHSSYYGPR